MTRAAFTKYQQFLWVPLVFLNGVKFSKVQMINRKWNVIYNHIMIIFLWTFTYYRSYFGYKFQKMDNFSQDRCFFKRKSSAKYSNYNVKTQRKIIRTWLCIIKQFLFTYRNFESFESFKNNKKTLKNCWCLVKTTLSIYLILSKLVFFETSIIFLELALKSIYRNFLFEKVTMILIRTIEVLVSCFPKTSLAT